MIFGKGQYSNAWIPFMNMEYYFGVEMGDFYAAQMNCLNLNSYLVVISNKETQKFVNTTIRQIAGKHDLIS